MQETREPEQLFDPRHDDRIRRHSASSVNEKLDLLARATVEARGEQGRDALVARLAELDREWDVDRALMLNFAVAGALTSELGRHAHRAWTWVFRSQLAFLAMHALVGWCPPLVLFRRLGFRTQREIAAERAAIVHHLRAGSAH